MFKSILGYIGTSRQIWARDPGGGDRDREMKEMVRDRERQRYLKGRNSLRGGD